MPKSITMDLRCVLALGAALAVAAMCCPPADAIVGGDTVSLDQHPYQVALVRAGLPAVDDDGQYCGGSIRDQWHIITAAHCVFDNPASPSGQPMTPADIDVLAGTESLGNEGPPAQRVHVERISYDPSFNEDLQHDGALLTLATPLQLQAKVQPLALVSNASWAATAPGAALFVTGWGSTAPSTGPVISLRGVQVKAVSDTTCNADYQSDIPPIPFDGTVQTCAGDTTSGGKDACQGDSGGPLVKANGAVVHRGRRAGRDRLLGRRLRSRASFPASTPRSRRPRSGPSSRWPTRRPLRRNTSAPALAGAAAIGQQLTCSPGAWTGAPTVLLPVRPHDAAGDVGVAASGAEAAYVVTAAGCGHGAALRRLRRQPRRRERRLERAEPRGARPTAAAAAHAEQLSPGQPRARRPRDALGVHGHALHADGDGHRRGLLRRDQDPAGDGALDLPRQVHQARPARGVHTPPDHQAARSRRSPPTASRSSPPSCPSARSASRWSPSTRPGIVRRCPPPRRSRRSKPRKRR